MSHNVVLPTATAAHAHRYRVDNVPWLIRPLYLAAAWILGLTMYLYYLVCRLTSRISIEGSGNHDLSRQAIYCMWHESWWPWLVVFLRYASAHALFSHPAAYMKPVHTVFRLMRVRALFLGSSGEEGREAANKVAALVRNGWCTTISPDGPSGPPRTLKKGVLHIAGQTGVPIVPLAIRSSKHLPWPSWDSKRIPLPFSKITVRIQPPLFVDTSNFDLAASELTHLLES